VRAFKSRVTIQNLSRAGSSEMAVSAFNLLQIGVKSGHEIRLRAEGEDEAETIEALRKLVEDNFGES
jgi:phosphocarrier protein